MLEWLLADLRYDPLLLINSLETPLGVKTQREALGGPRGDENDLVDRLVRAIILQQRPEGSWEGLVTATAQSIHNLLDCGVPVHSQTV